jgi:hypothetical protein
MGGMRTSKKKGGTMGFDVYGINGNHFRNSSMWWPLLWHYATDECPFALTDEEILRGFYNDGLFITEEKALVIGGRLLTCVACGFTAKEERAFQAYRDSKPEKLCASCKGTGYGTDRGQTCKACEGGGVVRLEPCQFSTENVLKFGQFCLASGGFWIY